MPERYALFAMLPRIAIPSAPPSSRVVSFTADPMPAFDSGTALMISPVAGAAVTLIPAPSTAKIAASVKYAVSASTRLSAANPSATIARPTAMTRVAPKRAASVALRGDNTTNTIGNGSSARPASSGE